MVRWRYLLHLVPGIFLYLGMGVSLHAQTARTQGLPDGGYEAQPMGELHLNYYYDNTGRWVKFSDWIPFKQKKYEPMFLEDFYLLYGLPIAYNVPEVKESIYYLVQALTHRFRHPRNALCKIETEEQYHKYRLLMYMHVNVLIMRKFLRLGSLYDKRHLYFHDMDVADDLEVSFKIAHTYYDEARIYWKQAKRYAEEADAYPVELDLPGIESERFMIRQGKLDFDRIIDLHVARVEAKLGYAKEFLDQEGRPRPVKQKMLDDVKSMYDGSFTPAPITEPVLNPVAGEKPLFDEKDLFPPIPAPGSNPGSP